MKVCMIPGKESIGQPNGISRVIENYYRYGHTAGIDFIENEDKADLIVSHAGMLGANADVSILHGIYFTGDYPAERYEYHVNRDIIDSLRACHAITVPSSWVAEIIQRDLHINPFVVPHGINAEDWKPTGENNGYVLYAKNRDGADVCNSIHIDKLASMAPDTPFVSTFSKSNLPNMQVTGVRPHPEMKRMIQGASVYASLTKETFGVATLEALASGVPVLGWKYGGNLDIVQHGVNGYLAEPGNYDDLLAGLFYIYKYRKVLSDNAIETAKQWSWENALQKLRSAFDFAMTKKQEPDTVSVIIPVYNYVDKMERAIQGVISQSYPVNEIIVVNDGSTDNFESKSKELNQMYPKVKFVSKQNGGVATARNFGAKLSTSKYLCFLDADDTLNPDFIKTCVDALKKDKSLYIAYTGLGMWDGNRITLSQWPSDWDFDAQLKRRNQVPTCCVMRREVIDRLGGFRQRFAPQGAGAEDADLWTRAGEYGMKARQVAKEPLFIYTINSGNTSKKDYVEPDWLSWDGFVKTGISHIASYSSPRNHLSHPVYQYDQPTVSVIIPVGPGHAKDILSAMDSVEGQTFSNWELIVVNDSGEKLDLSPWPYARLYETPHPRSGPGVARNIGVKNSRGGFVVFLDADDWLAIDALEQMLIAWAKNHGIVYTDYYGIATVRPEDISQFGDRVVEYNPKKQQALMKHYSDSYDCERAQRMPDSPLYHWCIVTCLIPKAWHDEIGGYDESMESWEDVDYHWRMARAGKCYTHLSDHLVYYQFDSGNRRQAANPETNGAVAQKLIQYMQQKYERTNPMPCTTCGGNRDSVQPSRSTTLMATSSTQRNTDMDQDFVMVMYASPNKGEHQVTGPNTGIKYGYHSGGDRFLAHKKDIEGLPNLFIPVENAVPTAVEAPRSQPVAPAAPTPVQPIEYVPNIKKFSVDMIPGVTPAIADSLKEMGITTAKDFIGLKKETLTKIKGVGENRAKAILNAIDSMKEKLEEYVEQ